MLEPLPPGGDPGRKTLVSLGLPGRQASKKFFTFIHSPNADSSQARTGPYTQVSPLHHPHLPGDQACASGGSVSPARPSRHAHSGGRGDTCRPQQAVGRAHALGPAQRSEPLPGPTVGSPDRGQRTEPQL